MIECLTNNGNEFFTGTWYEDLHSVEGKTFRYELLTDPRKSYGMVINNLLKEQGRKTIKTNWNFGWKPKQIVVDNYGEPWKIEEVIEMPQEVNAQVVYFALNPDIAFVLSMVKIANPMELGK